MADSAFMTHAPVDLVSPPVARPVDSPGSAIPSAPAGPLSAEHLNQLAIARQRGKSIRRAVAVASFNGWTAGLFAAVSLVCGVFSLVGFLLGAALAIAAYNEFRGAQELRRFDEGASRRLGLNQVGLCAALVLYGAWGVYSTYSTSSAYAAALAGSAQAAQLVGSIERLEKTVSLGVYGGLIVLSILFQGGTAWYYFTRRRVLRAYISETPAWILELERARSPR